MILFAEFCKNGLTNTIMIFRFLKGVFECETVLWVYDILIMAEAMKNIHVKNVLYIIFCI